jgi:hypothetical protein
VGSTLVMPAPHDISPPPLDVQLILELEARVAVDEAVGVFPRGRQQPTLSSRLSSVPVVGEHSWPSESGGRVPVPARWHHCGSEEELAVRTEACPRTASRGPHGTRSGGGHGEAIPTDRRHH